jgi:hypothetical protein
MRRAGTTLPSICRVATVHPLRCDGFIRCRDMTCRFPGCDAPAEHCDIDHTVAYPAGPTHPSNLKSLCRKHHLIKTFYTGVSGWADVQLPDGTLIWTLPDRLQ